MAGHSKWSKIKRIKAVKDAKKGKAFSKIIQQITTVVRMGGGDPDANASLRLLLDKAKSEGVPASNIKKAINRGLGISEDGRTVETIIYEGYGPGGVGFIVETFTDNSNRTVADLRKLFGDHGGRLSETGSVSWNFVQVGVLIVPIGKFQKAAKFGERDQFVAGSREDLELELLDVDGIRDILSSTKKEELDDGTVVDALIVITEKSALSQVKSSIEQLGYYISDFHVDWLVKERKNIDADTVQKVQNLVESLLEYPDVRMVWTEVSSL